MITRMDRDRQAPTPRRRLPGVLAGVRRTTALAALGTAVGIALLAGCGNGLQVSPSSGSGTPVTTPDVGRASAGRSEGSAGSDPSAGRADGGPGSTDPSGTAGQEPTSSPSGSDDTGSSSKANGAGSDHGVQPGAAPKSGATCSLADLQVAVRVPPGGAGAGSRYVLIDFTNTSGGPCWLYGYAGVSFVGHQNGTMLGRPASRDYSQPPRPVRLGDGATTSELVQIANAANFPARLCAPTTSDGFRIYPPASTAAAYVPFRTDACQGRKATQLTVYPVGTKG